MDLSTLIARVRSLLREKAADVATADQFFSDTEITGDLNDGLDIISGALEIHSEELTDSVLVDTAAYDFSTALSVDAVYFKATGNTDYERMLIKTRKELDNMFADWETAQTAPLYALVEQRGANVRVTLAKVPSTAGTIRIVTSSKIEDLSEDTDSPAIPSIYHNSLVNYAVSINWDRRLQFDTAERYMVKFQTQLAQMKKDFTASTNTKSYSWGNSDVDNGTSLPYEGSASTDRFGTTLISD